MMDDAMDDVLMITRMLPLELKCFIFKKLMFSCAKGLAFEEKIQESWLKINLKRIETELEQNGSNEIFRKGIIELFLLIDDLPERLSDDLRSRFHEQIYMLREKYEFKFIKSRRWIVSITNISAFHLMHIYRNIQHANHSFIASVSEYNDLFGYAMFHKELDEPQVKDILCLRRNDHHPPPEVNLRMHLPFYLCERDWDFLRHIRGYTIAIGKLVEEQPIELKYPTMFSNFLLLTNLLSPDYIMS